MRIIHTSDWHIGQTLNGYSREAEHQAFLDDLGDLIVAQEADALLIAGDVFDGINPSGDAQRQLYGAMAGFLRRRPGLAIVMIAGNHDSAGRMEAPAEILSALGVHMVGTLRRGSSGVDLDRHLIALRDAAGVVRAHVLAIPFLRAGDLPGLVLGAEATGTSAVVAATRQVHADLVEAALVRSGGLPVIAMGHLTCLGGIESEGAERRILIGGEHAVPPDVFPPGLAYVALGHLHRHQNIDGGRIRYSGSPLPLSATEIAYDHGVTLVEFADGDLSTSHLPLPRRVAMLRLPAQGAATTDEIEQELVAASLDPSVPDNLRPFVHLVLKPHATLPVIQKAVDEMMGRYPVRLASQRIERAAPVAASIAAPPVSLAEWTPEKLFVDAFQKKHGQPPSSDHLSAFQDASSEV